MIVVLLGFMSKLCFLAIVVGTRRIKTLTLGANEWVSSNSSTLIAGQSFLWLIELWSCGRLYCFYQNWVMDSWVVDDVSFKLPFTTTRSHYSAAGETCALKDSKVHVVSCNEPKKLTTLCVCLCPRKIHFLLQILLLSQNSTTNQKTQFTLKLRSL